MGAPKAVQSLTLVGGGCTEAFEPQLLAMDNVKEKVLCLLSRGHDIPDEPSSKLVLRRRVFQKVSFSFEISRSLEFDILTLERQVGGTDDVVQPVVIPVSEDPVGRVRKMQHMWAVTHHIVGGIQQPDGRVTRANPSIIRPGDFVDVAVTIQVVSLRVPGGHRGVDVMFVPQTVVRLCTVDQACVCRETTLFETKLTRYG